MDTVILEDNLTEKDENDDNNEIHCKSWISPSYVIPEKITEIEEPDIIKRGELKYLKQMTLKKIFEQTENIEISLRCSKCHKEINDNDEPSIITPCGHLVCKECTEIEKCPLCDSPVKEINKIYFEDECALCLNHKPNTISLPCDHMCMCYECAAQNSLNNFNCPMCNEPLSGYKFVFNDISSKSTDMHIYLNICL